MEERGNQLIHKRLSKTKSIGRESYTQTVARLWWMAFGVETGGRFAEEDKIGFLEEECF